MLSGGEKSRVALAKTLISESNFLLLDEPTNHLDIISVNILIQALQQYKGTFVLVSHDRYFISEVANKIWYIDNQLIKEYPGTYPEYEIWKKATQINQAPIKQQKKSSSTSKKNKNRTNNAELQINNQISKLKKKLESVEDEIESTETEIVKIEEKMSEPEIYSNLDKLAEANKDYDKLKSKLEDKNLTWEELVEEIEKLE